MAYLGGFWALWKVLKGSGYGLGFTASGLRVTSAVSKWLLGFRASGCEGLGTQCATAPPCSKTRNMQGLF